MLWKARKMVREWHMPSARSMALWVVAQAQADTTAPPSVLSASERPRAACPVFTSNSTWNKNGFWIKPSLTEGFYHVPHLHIFDYTL